MSRTENSESPNWGFQVQERSKSMNMNGGARWEMITLTIRPDFNVPSIS